MTIRERRARQRAMKAELRRCKRQALAAEYQRRSLRQMAAVRGVSWQAVQQQLVRVGVRLRTKGGDQRRFRAAA